MNSDKGMSRADFLKVGAVGLGAAAMGASLAGCSGAQAVQAEDGVLPDGASWAYEADVVVAGCGSGGAPAVIKAAEAGADVLVVEKTDWLGGDMRRCGGGIAGAGTCVQKALGVEDTPDSLYDYMTKCGKLGYSYVIAGDGTLTVTGYRTLAQSIVDEELLRIVADESAEVFDWIVQDLAGQTEADWAFSTPEDKGATICCSPGLNYSGTPISYDQVGLTPVQRCYWFEANPDDLDKDGSRGYADEGFCGHGSLDKARGGTGLWKGFQDRIDQLAPTVLYETALTRLVQNSDGEIIGIVADDGTKDVYIKAHKGVILATGTFVNNDDMCLDYALSKASKGRWSGNSWEIEEHCDGAGVQSALAVGAGTVNMGLGGDWGSGCGGIKINTDAQVLDVFGDPIPRLFASSYVVGGAWGRCIPVADSITCGT